MEEEQIKQEAEEYAKENYCDEARATARNAYLDCARLKEKQISDLTKKNEVLNKMIEVYEKYTDNELDFDENGELVY